MKHSIWRSLLLTLFCLVPIAVKAQVTPDGTTNTNVTQSGDNYTVEQGDRILNKTKKCDRYLTT